MSDVLTDSADRVVELEATLRAEGVPSVLTITAAAKIAEKTPAVLARLARVGVIQAKRTASTAGRGHWRVTRRALAQYLAGGEVV